MINSRLWKQFKKNKLAIICLLIIIGYFLIAIFAPLISPHEPYEIQIKQVLTPPDSSYLFGTDQFGRDVLSRVIYGTRISFRVAIISVFIAMFFGIILGVIGGYFGGWIDILTSRFTDILFSFPDILLALAIMAILGQSINNVAIAIAIVYIPIFARISRGSTLIIKDALYIEASRAIGVSNFIILIRHVIPNIISPVIVQASISFSFAILAEAALSFLGLGVEPDTPSWGIMLSNGKDWMEQAWWISIYPGLAMTLAAFSFNVVGDGLRDALDPQTKK